MFIHDIIKIKYINEGYLPNYPYHMITDKEMFDAFLLPEQGYFAVNYPLLATDLQNKYDELIAGIQKCIQKYLENDEAVPSWVYSYMLGNTISVDSEIYDIMYLFEIMNLESDSTDIFSAELQEECLKVSEAWLNKLPAKYGSRPATMFGEPHVIKSLRLAAVDVLDSGGA